MVTRHLGAQAAPSTTVGESNTATLTALRRLTPRQRDVLDLMTQGKSSKRICQTLNLAAPTLKNHVAAILQILNVTSRTEAVIKASRASALSMPNSRAPQTYLGYIPGAL